MHKKKNSASVLAGELILTFYKRKKPRERGSLPTTKRAGSEAVLSKVFDECLGTETKSFTSEALFNRLVIELWRHRALSCLNLDRRTFATNLEERGWSYDPKAHLWSLRVNGPRPAGVVSLFEL